jgi:S1-C subfamily serine protease
MLSKEKMFYRPAWLLRPDHRTGDILIHAPAAIPKAPQYQESIDWHGPGQWRVPVVKPAIVNISTTRTVVAGGQTFLDDPFFKRFGDNLGRQNNRKNKICWARIRVYLSSDGYIITNYHVIKPMK